MPYSPTMLWNAAGEFKVFDDPADADDGWKPFPPPAPPADIEPLPPLTRRELVMYLDAGKMPYSPRARVSELAEVLDKAVKAAAKEHGVVYPDDASTREILALLGPK
jgi:hypothetical protein